MVAALLAAATSVYTAVVTTEAAASSEIRDERKSAYADFLAAERSIESSVSGYLDIIFNRSVEPPAPSVPEEVDTAFDAQFDAELPKLREAASAVELVGSDDVRRQAEIIVSTYEDLEEWISADRDDIRRFESGQVAYSLDDTEGPHVFVKKLEEHAKRYRTEFLTSARSDLGLEGDAGPGQSP